MYNKSYSYNNEQKAMFLLKIVLANSRNERFHGNVFPPYRSSKATLATFAHAYYLLHISYCLLLDVFLYRNYNVITLMDVDDIANKNVAIYKTIFEKQISD